MPERDELHPRQQLSTIAIDPRRVAEILGLAGAVLVVVGTAVSVIRIATDRPFGVADFSARFELYNDQTLPTWFASVLLLLSVPLLLIMARVDGPFRGGDRVRWLGLAGLVLVFSADEVATFHEYTAAFVGVEVPGLVGAYTWVVFGMVFLVVATAVYAPFVRRLPNPLRRRLVVAAGVFFGGALGVEMFNGRTGSTIGHDNYLYVLMSSVEESLELIGALVLLWALLMHLGESDHRLEISFDPSVQHPT